MVDVGVTIVRFSSANCISSISSYSSLKCVSGTLVSIISDSSGAKEVVYKIVVSDTFEDLHGCVTVVVRVIVVVELVESDISP